MLAGCTSADLDFPYMSLRELWVGDVPVRALRVTYVGELGWELYCPTEFGAALWQALWEAGEPQGGVGFCVKLDKGDFIGREALLAARERGADRQLCCLVLDDREAVAVGNEPVTVDGVVLGRVTSGGYGYTVGASIAYAYLPAEHSEPGTAIAVEIFGDWIEGQVAAEPLYDPSGERLRSG